MDRLEFVAEVGYMDMIAVGSISPNCKMFLEADLTSESMSVVEDIAKAVEQLLFGNYSSCVSTQAQKPYYDNVEVEVYLTYDNKSLVKVYLNREIRSRFFGKKFVNITNLRRSISNLSASRKVEIVIWFEE